MFHLILILVLLVSPVAFAEEQTQLEPRDVSQRIFDLERSLRNLQSQIDRLSSTVSQNDRDSDSIKQNVSNLERRLDHTENEVDDLESEQRDLSRRLGR